MTYLSGSLAQPSIGSDEFAQLPAWAAPASYVYLSVYTKAGIGGVVLITPGGLMYAYDGNAILFTSLAGQSFPAAQSAPPATPIALLAGLWQSAQGLYDTGDPGYFVSNGIVHLTGSVTSAGLGLLSSLREFHPPAWRLAHTLGATSSHTLPRRRGMKAVLDAGALVAVDRRGWAIGAQLRVVQQQETPIRVSSAVVGQVWRDGRKQANLTRVLAGVGIEALGKDEGKRIGELLTLAKSAGVIDAHVALMTAPTDLVLTSDPGDIRQLLQARRVRESSTCEPTAVAGQHRFKIVTPPER